MKRFVLGTAGHVDHGKTALVQALTGVNTDRLPEEKRRGISIELGFAPLELSDDLIVSVVDVPGHERFVRTMIGGAAKVDAVLLVVAANEGIRLQTREHLEICRLLGIREFVCALTKIDLVDAEQIERRRAEIREHFKTMGLGRPDVIPLSAQTGLGISELRDCLRHKLSSFPAPSADGALALSIDRVFSLPGHGTIVTGTLAHSRIVRGERLRVLPDDFEVTVRALQMFGEPTETAEPNSRVAVNVTGADRSRLRKGQVLTREGELSSTRRIHTTILPLHPELQIPRRNLRVTFGMRSTLANLRLRQQSELFGELTFDEPIVVRSGERFVLRNDSIPATVGGGEVLDPEPDLRLNASEPERWAPLAGADRLRFWLKREPKDLDPARLARRSGVSVATAKEVLESMVRTTPALPVAESPAESHPEVLERVEAGALTPPTVTELVSSLRLPVSAVRTELARAARSGRLARVTDDLYISHAVVTELRSKIARHFATATTLTLADWKSAVQISRKFAVPILEYFDREKVTLCRPDRTRIAGPSLARYSLSP